MRLFLKLFVLTNIISISLHSQQFLSKEEALAIALDVNFGIQVSKNNLEISENNSSLLNSGFLPSISFSGGTDYGKSNSEIEFPNQFLDDGSLRQNLILNNQETTRYNSGVNLNYILFDGLGRKFNYKKLKELYSLSELQSRETIEFTVLQLYSVYFKIVELSESINIFKQALEISKKRKFRAKSSFKHGQVNKLAVLNAQVDVTNDSISLLEIEQNLDNANRDMNLLLNQSIDQVYVLEKEVDFIPRIKIEELLKSAAKFNVSLLKQKHNIQINSYDIKVSQSGYLPSVGLFGFYGWNLTQNPASAFFSGTNNNKYSFNIGANVTWNLFDGGQISTQVRNAKIALDNQKILAEKTQLTFDRDLSKSWQNYKNAIQIYNIQEKQVETATYSFNRSEAQYKLGSISAIEFRQAQINLRNAQYQRNLKKYQAKLTELNVLQISGQLLNVKL